MGTLLNYTEPYRKREIDSHAGPINNHMLSNEHCVYAMFALPRPQYRKRVV